ncbi:hypothetical protein N9Y17_04465 [Gammaproteobacteria bacterium]|nr:hypothetical protein [Gammaproteobacteria bacterium]
MTQQITEEHDQQTPPSTPTNQMIQRSESPPAIQRQTRTTYSEQRTHINPMPNLSSIPVTPDRSEDEHETSTELSRQ